MLWCIIRERKRGREIGDDRDYGMEESASVAARFVYLFSHFPSLSTQKRLFQLVAICSDGSGQWWNDSHEWWR